MSRPTSSALVLNYRQDFRSPNGRRYRLIVQLGVYDLSTATGTYDLPDGVIELSEIQSSFDKFPLGFTDALTVKYKLNYTPLERGVVTDFTLQDFVKAMSYGFYFDGTEYYYNVFVLTSDRGNSALDYDEFHVEAVTGQRPTIERKYSLNKPLHINEIDTICLGKLVAETYTMNAMLTDYYSEYSEASETRTTVQPYDFYKDSSNGIANVNYQDYFVTYTYSKSAQLLLQRFIFLLTKKIYSKITQATFDSSGINTLLFTTYGITPFEAVTFYTNDNTDNQQPTSTAISNSSLTVLTRLEIQESPIRSIGGFLSPASSESPFKNYNNVWNFFQDLSEQLCTKATFNYEFYDGLNVLVYPTFKKLLDGGTYTYDARDFEVEFSQGGDSVRGCKITLNPRGSDDMKEYDNSSFLSIADNEYNLKNFIFNTQPDAPDTKLIGRFGSNAFKYVIYGSKLYNQATSPMVRVGDKITITFGTGESVTSSSGPTSIFPIGNESEIANSIYRRQLAGGVIQGIARAIFLAFEANGNGFVEFEMFKEDVKVGDIITLTNTVSSDATIGGYIGTPSGASVSFANCIVTELVHEVVTEKVKVKAFVYQPIGIVT